MEAPTDRIFLQFSAAKLKQMTSRITDCLNRLNHDQVWIRGSENENAIGNLVLHLCGNVSQWIGTGVGGWPNERVRDREFAARAGAGPAVLADRLQRVMTEAISIIENVATERLNEKITLQGYTVTILEAIYHVVEHFSYHAGQIIFATKQLKAEDLDFYGHLSAAAHAETTP